LATSPALVHVWRIKTATEHDPEVLSAEELEVAARFHFERDRVRYVASHVQLRQILSRYVGQPAEEIQFALGPMGKPFVSLDERSVTFNLSHSGDRALIGVSSGPEVGIDIEHIRHGSSLSDVARSSFSPGENRWLESLAPGEQLRGFFRIWTLKEACLKAAGTGLSISPNRFELTITGDGIRLASREEALAGPWDVRELATERDYCAAVAVRGAIGELEMV
jgi:4'-phosphopantetheinyl transferase